MAYPERFSMTSDFIGGVFGDVINAPQGSIATKLIKADSTATFYPCTPVVLQADGTVDRATAIGDAIYGFVAYNPIKTINVKGESISVLTNDVVVNLKAGAVITAGQKLEISLSGAGEQDRVVPVTTGSVIGVALNPAAENEIVRVRIAIVNV